MTQKEYYIASDLETQTQFLDYLLDEVGYLAVDTETTSVDSFSCKIMGVSLSKAPGEAFYFPVNEFIDNKVTSIDPVRWASLVSKLKQLFTHPDVKIIMHNSSFDVWVLRNTLGIDTMPKLYADTMLLKHTVDEQKPHGLKEIGAKLFGEDAKDEQQVLKESVIANGGKWNAESKDMYMADQTILGTYACADTDLTIKIFEVLSQELESQGLMDFFYKDEVMPLNEVIIEHMVGTGIKCDIEYFTKLKKELEEESLRLEQEAHQSFQKEYPMIYDLVETELLEKEYPLTPRGNLFKDMYMMSGLTVYNDKDGNPSFVKKLMDQEFKDHPDSLLLQWKLGLLADKDFAKAEYDLVYNARKNAYTRDFQSRYVINLGSSKQLQDILFNKLGEEATFTKKGNAMVDVDVLEQFAKQYTFLAKVLEWRKITKLLTTYVEGILAAQTDSIIRPGWLQHGTDSGRLSCRDPNFQNLPRDDKRIKHGIIAREGKVLIGADYAQLEPRVFAHYSDEDVLINSFKNGDDFYGLMAIQLFHLKGEPNTIKKSYPKERQDTKEFALGVPYGLKKWKLAKLINCDVEEAQQHIDNYWKTYPNLHTFTKVCHGEALTYGFVKSQAGRIRRFTGMGLLKNSRSWEDKKVLNKLLNLSVNFKIQSTAASIVNRAMILLKKEFEKRNLDAKILIQIHDEIIVECNEADAELVAGITKDAMENSYVLSLPLLAEPQIGHRLDETK